MAEKIHHFNVNFDFLYTQENENDICNENSQKVEKEKRFSDLTEEQKIQLFVDVEAKATKSSNLTLSTSSCSVTKGGKFQSQQ